MTPREILKQLQHVYRQAETYADEESYRVQGDEPKSCKSFFSAPDKFRCEYPDLKCWVDKPGGIYLHPPERGVSSLWCDGRSVYRKSFYEQHSVVESNFNLDDWASTGMWPAVAKPALQLLFSGHGQGSLPALLLIQNAKRVEDDYFSDDLCYRITGSIETANDSEIWISQADYTLRCLRQKLYFSMMRSLDIADDVPPNTELDFNTEFFYRRIELNKRLDEALFARPSDLKPD